MAAELVLLPRTTKTCTKCGRTLPIAQFYNDRIRKAHGSSCKDCESQRKADWYKAHADRIRAHRVSYGRTIDGFTTRVWDNLNSRTINGIHPWSCKNCRTYLNRGIRLEITREELKAAVAASWSLIQAIWASGESVHIHRIGPSIHYSADNIEFLSQSEHRARHRRRI